LQTSLDQFKARAVLVPMPKQLVATSNETETVHSVRLR